jgi:tetratricopeptide (TPR) repeat protein
MHLELGERERAIAVYEATLRRARAIGDDYVQAQCLDGLGHAALEERRLEEAAAMVDEAYGLYVRLDDRYRIPINVARFSWVLAAAGRATEAAQVLAAAEAELERIGASVAWVEASNAKTRATIREHLDEDAFAEASRVGEKLAPDQAAAMARNILRPP